MSLFLRTPEGKKIDGGFLCPIKSFSMGCKTYRRNMGIIPAARETGLMNFLKKY